MFYGWRVVAVCFVAATLTWGFGVFGASVYLTEVTRTHGWAVAIVSGGVTVFYLANAASLTLVGGTVDRFGPRPVFLFGTVMLSLGIAVLGQAATLPQLYGAFVLLGFGYACLSLTGLTAALSPWFERHQGRSVAIALMGASFGGMLVVPLLVMAIQRFGFPHAMLGGATLTAAVLLPLAAIVLRYRRPQELGLLPDGAAAPAAVACGGAGDAPVATHTRAEALRTAAFWTATVAFALGFPVQVGFFTHQLNFSQPALGAAGAAWLMSASGFANLLGRLLLARIVDRLAVRRYTAAVFAAQACVLAALALAPTFPVLIGACLVYGFCLGQITTLSPIVMRREFGAASFGAIYGTAATVIQLSSAFGPSLYGVVRDWSGGYGPVLGVAAMVEAVAAVAMIVSRPANRVPRLVN